MEQFPDGPGLGTLLRHLVELLDSDVEAIYREQGIDCRSRFTPVIRYIRRNGPASIRAIASHSGLSHSAVSQTVTEMLKRGLVTSTPGADARERIVSFSPAGCALVPRLLTVWRAIGAASDEIDNALQAPLRETLVRAIEAVDRRPLRERVRARLAANGLPAD